MARSLLPTTGAPIAPSSAGGGISGPTGVLRSAVWESRLRGRGLLHRVGIIRYPTRALLVSWLATARDGVPGTGISGESPGTRSNLSAANDESCRRPDRRPTAFPQLTAYRERARCRCGAVRPPASRSPSCGERSAAPMWDDRERGPATREPDPARCFSRLGALLPANEPHCARPLSYAIPAAAMMPPSWGNRCLLLCATRAMLLPSSRALPPDGLVSQRLGP